LNRPIFKKGKTMKKMFLLIIFLFLIGCTSNEFKIGWLSDTHVSPFTSGPQDLRAVVRDINQKDDIDLVIVSGDITDTNTGNNLILAKRILDSLKVPYFIIPGNHDTKWSDSGLEKFRRLFKDDKFVFDFKGIKFIGLHQGPVLRMADGHFSPDDLNWLKNILKKMNRSGQPVVFVTHYPLFPVHHVDNALNFFKIIKGYNVKMILSGHVHRNKVSNAYGIPQIMGRSILRRDSLPAYNIIKFSGDSVIFFVKYVGLPHLKQWAKLDFRKKYQIEDSLIRRPDFSINQIYPQAKESWRVSMTSLITASPNFDGHFVYIGDHAGKLHCINSETGRQVWQRAFPGALFSQVAIEKDRLLFTSADSNVYCIKNIDGSEFWKFKTQAPLYSIPIVHGDTVFVAGNDGNCYALSLRTGQPIWVVDGIKGYVECKPLLVKDKIIFGAWDGHLYALKRKNGRLAWKWSGPRQNILFSPAACWPVTLNDQVFFATPDRYLNNVHLKDGHTFWRDHRFKVRETVGSNGHLVFAKTMQDTVVALIPNKGKPIYAWIKNLQFGYDFANSMIQLKNGVGYFGTKNGLVISFQAKNGKLLWQHKIGNSFIPTVLPISKNEVIVSSMDGLLVKLSPGKP